MGNTTGRKDEEEEEEEEEETSEDEMDFVEDAEPIFPQSYPPTLIATPQQVTVAGIPRASSPRHMPNHTSFQHTPYSGDVAIEKAKAMMITWSYGGKQVALTGSWDSWEKREPMYRSGQDFIIMKMISPGLYHYGFIVDGHFTYAPDLPWERDDAGGTFNVLDVQDTIPEAPESLSEFKLPASPESSYGNDSLNYDFNKPPPLMPPQLLNAPGNELSTATGTTHHSLRRPNYEVLNHLYVQNNEGSHQPLALGLTHRFRNKYVTVVLYKASTN